MRLALQYEQNKLLQEKGDASYAVEKQLELNFPTLGGRSEKELFEMLKVHEREQQPAELLENEQGTKISELMGEDKQRSQSRKKLAFFSSSDSELVTSSEVEAEGVKQA